MLLASGAAALQQELMQKARPALQGAQLAATAPAQEAVVRMLTSTKPLFLGMWVTDRLRSRNSD